MVVDPFVEKSHVVREMADRCLAGEFGGSSWLAAKEPECVALGIIPQNITCHMDKLDPVALRPERGTGRVSPQRRRLRRRCMV